MRQTYKSLIVLSFGLLFIIGQTSAQTMKQKTMSDSMMQKMHMPDSMAKMSKQEGMKMHETMSEDSSAVLYYYTCPMESHKQIHSDEPGECPECGMEMVKVVSATAETADFYGCSMPDHSGIRSDKPGKCSECGMDLQPLRLEKVDLNNME
ncbi:MAG: heavy metal-binding domain-containing protein [Fidelibacterota bacterium]